MMPETLRVGVISDTHGLLRPEALAALAGVDHLIHAGDVGHPEVLERLREIAPLTVVRGNNDRGVWGKALPAVEFVELAGRYVYVIHDIADMDLDPVAAEVSVVVAGHAHRPLKETRDGVLYLNPGSAGPRRFSLPVTLARLTLGASVDAEIVTLLPDKPARD